MGERWDNINNNGRIYKNTKTLQQDKNISALYNFATVIIMTIFVFPFLKNEKNHAGVIAMSAIKWKLVSENNFV